MRGGSLSRIAATAFAVIALPGCAAVQKYNPLLLIDDPLPSRAEREALRLRAEPEAPGPREAGNTGTEEVRLAATPAAAMPARPARTAGQSEDAAANAQLAQAAERLGLTIVPSMPEPGTSAASRPAPGGTDSYVAFYDHALSQLDAEGPRQSALLLDPPSIDPAVKPCTDQPSAVLVDLDPAAGLLPLVDEARPDPVLADLLGTLRDRGVTVFWISGHGPEAASAIRGILVESALDPAGADPLILMRFPGESKQKRRVGLADTHCLLAIAGDQRADFDELYDHVLDPDMAAPLEVLVGDGWFLTPPPID